MNRLLEVQGLEVRFPAGGRRLGRRTKAAHAVSGVDLHLDAGETLGIIGESGCGKSTTAQAILQLHRPTAGSVRFQGRELTALGSRGLRHVRRNMQIVFQDAYASLNPRMTVAGIVGEPLRIHDLWSRGSGEDRVAELLRVVGLDAGYENRFPHELSGGQRQRVSIARALALEPRMLLLDEPISALDTSVQATVLNVLLDLQVRLGLAYLVIAHDLAVIRYLSDRVAVMYLGKIVETGSCEDVLGHPLHPYTQALISAELSAGSPSAALGNRIVLRGEVPGNTAPPTGCRFRTRCWKAQEVCATREPPLVPQDGGAHTVACHFPEPRDMATPPAPSSPPLQRRRS